MSDFLTTKYGHSKIFQASIREAHNNTQDSLLQEEYSQILGNEYKGVHRQQSDKEQLPKFKMNRVTVAGGGQTRNNLRGMQSSENGEQKTLLEDELDREMDEDVERLLKNEVDQDTGNEPYYMQKANRLFEKHVKVASDEGLKRIETAFNEELQREQNYYLSCRTDTGKCLLNAPLASQQSRDQSVETESSVNRFKNVILVRKSRRPQATVPLAMTKLEKIDEERPKSILKKGFDRSRDTLQQHGGADGQSRQASGKMTSSEYFPNKLAPGTNQLAPEPNRSGVHPSRYPKIGNANYSSMTELSRTNLMAPSPLPASNRGKELLQNNLQFSSRQKPRKVPFVTNDSTSQLKDISSKYNQENIRNQSLENEAIENDPKELRIIQDLQSLNRNLNNLPPIDNYRSMYTSNSAHTIPPAPATQPTPKEAKPNPGELADQQQLKTALLGPPKAEAANASIKSPVTGYSDLYKLKKVPGSISIAKPLKVGKELHVVASSPQGRIKMKVNFDLRRLIDDS
jgi:hypothetical protein